MLTEQFTATVLPFVTKRERVRLQRTGRPKRTTTYGVARRNLKHAIDEAAIRALAHVVGTAYQSASANGLGKMRSDTITADVRSAIARAFADFGVGEVAP